MTRDELIEAFYECFPEARGLHPLDNQIPFARERETLTEVIRRNRAPIVPPAPDYKIEYHGLSDVTFLIDDVIEASEGGDMFAAWAYAREMRIAEQIMAGEVPPESEAFAAILKAAPIPTDRGCERERHPYATVPDGLASDAVRDRNDRCDHTHNDEPGGMEE